MRRLMTMAAALLLGAVATMGADTPTVSSPDGRLRLTVSTDAGRAYYTVDYNNTPMLVRSRLGLVASHADFSEGLTLAGADEGKTSRDYTMWQAKTSHVHYTANTLKVTLQTKEQQTLEVEFAVSDRDVAFRYLLPAAKGGNPKAVVISREVSSFNFPDGTTTFLSPQIGPMTGWERTKPSYEEDYLADQPLGAKSQFGQGFIFPCLFRVADKGWVLVSETGVSGAYCGSHLSDYSAAADGYTVAFPQAGENNGIGSAQVGMALPGATPWRTITVGPTLKPIVETTVSYDVVEPAYTPDWKPAPGRYTWSWLIWQDNSINYDDQIKFIDLASEMGFEYCLVDNWWDQQIGRERMARLSRYAQQKGVRLMLWYNSNGFENDAPQTPKHRMNTAIARDREMAWLKSIGVAGIKVDFFGGDKQQTMQLYEDILYDASRYGLQVIFHGCTLPRGWEMMYPNYVASEAVLASENVFFTDSHARSEAYELTMHPFCRNAVATMDWGGTIMNKYLSKDNKSRHPRYTTDVFEMAAAVVVQTAVQCIAMQPNNLQELPQFELDFLKDVPTAWDETRFLDGYPGQYVVLARRHGQQWYVAGLNAGTTARTVVITMPELAGQTVGYYTDDARKGPQLRQLKVDKKGTARVTLQPNGGIILRQ